MKPIAGYHAHIYFSSDSREAAQILREKIALEFKGQVRVHHLVPQPIGPHPLPMFEVDIPPTMILALRRWFAEHHGEHSILIHPITGDDLVDHRDFAEWVGPPLKLDLAFLERMQS